MATAVLLIGAGLTREPQVAQASPRAPSTAESLRASPANHVVGKAQPDATVGHLEHPARLASLFERLQALEAHRAGADVRIVQFGDSHTASDYGTSVARAQLARRFGDGGRGFIPLGPPHLRLFQAGELVGRGVGFEPLLGSSPKLRDAPDGFFGPTGVAMEARAVGSFLGSELSASADRFEIAYLAQPGGGSFDVLIDGQKRARVSTAGATKAAAWSELVVTRRPHSLETRAVGDGPVRLFGTRLEDDAAGVTWDALGINGAKATTLLATDEAHFTAQLAHIAPALVVVAYGTNESGDSTTTPEDHAVALRSLLSRARASRAECLVLGPPDRGARTLAKLGLVIAVQRRAADEAGCAFYDQQGAMGGTNAIGRWAAESPRRAQSDFVHLTRSGYAVVGQALADDLIAAYETWKRERVVATR
ncbi:MAG TPA: GDSL-type esterase/lipase family protein [Labilithrix sp.]|nr:GDSL-type esterase/lipase family protein [Labilithrix sp.]